jgi:hypothetical protein
MERLVMEKKLITLTDGIAHLLGSYVVYGKLKEIRSKKCSRGR